MKTILVVDDEHAIAEMLRVMLESEGYRVVIAANGREALESFGAVNPALVISDLMMPVLDGSELSRRLKADPTRSRVPIVLMSAVGKRLISADVVYEAFLRKPFDVGELLAVVERLIGKP